MQMIAKTIISALTEIYTLGHNTIEKRKARRRKPLLLEIWD